MSNQMRSIAVTVEETKPGVFLWRLLEHDGAEWTPLDVASRSVRSYAESMAAGLVALQALIDDFDVGPRQAAPPLAAEADANPLSKPFGFGTLK
ncbi:hypothetical protein [Variovorax guangxiensis]|uniref:Uncharacterized protein n=1 Tax=Variovorax guangxiensis TaxID=1775474 RepID=A0A502DZM5_9BURK|nr:hypothetical protein [Variovorax guangxiensis]RZI65520.1 MAG: hypothetical protein EOP79_11105 [Variovorax sp.]TPG26384.1 hypothetical protein EAH83_00975 [Variovorax ginsengisoli]TPG30109.1 hypothetical protein EAH82_00975 [Variovorax guangxiensis]